MKTFQRSSPVCLFNDIVLTRFHLTHTHTALIARMNQVITSQSKTNAVAHYAFSKALKERRHSNDDCFLVIVVIVITNRSSSSTERNKKTSTTFSRRELAASSMMMIACNFDYIHSSTRSRGRGRRHVARGVG